MGALVAAGASAQDNSVIGPPQLKDFQLPGQRTTPPRPVGPIDEDTSPTTQSPPPRLAPPAIAVPAPPPPATTRVAQSPPPSQPTEPRAEPPTPRAATPATSSPNAPQPTARAAAPTPPPAAFTPSSESSAPPPSEGTAPDAAAAPSSGWNSLWLALPLLLAALAGLAYWRRRRSTEGAFPEDTENEFAPGPAAVPQAAAPVASSTALAARASRPAPLAKVESTARAWLEVEFKPSRAAATDKETIVHYELVLRNVGDAPAGNIRIDSKLFNAGAEAEIKAFLGGAIHEHSGSPHVLIAPEDELRLGSTIAMSKEDVREIVIDGRSLFVPAVAVNVAYNWGDSGAGRTSKSWLVGREAEQPSQKMGAFRLDLGPRIYRSVGQRQTGLAQMV
ncbi:MAG: hypothetical protein JWP15_2703 [Alphaproteobacteria bacterium]|nr:hypothetical protein [Alphaproteobacteria bacterium]